MARVAERGGLATARALLARRQAFFSPRPTAGIVTPIGAGRRRQLGER